MTVFQDAAAALHADPNLSVEAVYTPLGGDPLPPIRVIWTSMVEDAYVPGTRQARARHVEVAILVSDLPAQPRRGDTIQVGPEVFRIDNQPTLDAETAEYVATLVKA